MKKVWFLLVLFTITTLNAALILNDEVVKNQDFKIGYFYDDTSNLSIKDIEKTNFTQIISSQFTKGYRDGVSWFKIDIKNHSNKEDFVLYFTEPIWSNFDLYTKEYGSWKVDKNGLNIKFENRSIEDSNPAFKIKIPLRQSKTFYIKASTISGHIGEFQLFTHDEYFRPSRMSITQAYIIYAFVLFGIILLNIYNFLLTKERIYICYILYVISFIVFISMKSGSYLALGFNGWNEGLHVVGAFVLLFFLLFSRQFLELDKYMPKIDNVFKIFAVIFIVFIVLISQNILHSCISFNIFSSIFFMLLFITTLKIWFNGSINAKYYLLAIMIFLPTMGMMTLTFNDILPNTDFTRYSFLAGALIEVIFFTLLLTNKYMDVNIVNSTLLKQTKELQEIKEQLTIEATTDMLSGLYNRRYFFEASLKSFYTALRYKQNLSILMVDLDDFKNVNDVYGHLFGDRVIRIFSNILRKAIRNSDIAARYGGEEFIVLLPETKLDKAIMLAQRIREEMELKEMCPEIGDCSTVTVSIGVTQLDNENDVDIEQAINRCDKALYKAKQNGRNRVCHL